MSTIDSYIHRKVVVLHQESLAKQAALAMCEQNIGCVLVCNKNSELLGIVTDRDLACSVATSSKGADLTLSEIMTPRPVCVDEDVELEAVIQLMQESGVRRIPVVKTLQGNKKRCVGIITLDDLIVSRLVNYDQLARIVRSQVRRKWAWYSPEHLRSTPVLRSEARAEQTLNHFYKIIAEKTRIPADLLPQVTQFLLGCVIRRLPYTGAAHFIAQLPKNIQEDLLDLPAGPDRSIDIKFMNNTLKSRYGFSEENAKSMISHFFPTLKKLVDPHEINHLEAQLPLDFRSLFEMKPTALRAGGM